MPRYFIKLYKRRRWLFFVVAAFCLGQGFFMVKGVETVPFFLFGMYSEPNEGQRVYQGLMVEEDGQALDLSALPGLQKDLILTPLYRYVALHEVQFEDPIKPAVRKRFEHRLSADTYLTFRERLSNAPADRERFHQWFRSYLESVYGRSMGVIRVYRVGMDPESQGDRNWVELREKQILFET